MNTDVGIRSDAAAAVTTRVTLATAEELAGRCSHGKLQWRIDGELWHVKSIMRGHQNLVPCDQQLRLEASK